MISYDGFVEKARGATRRSEEKGADDGPAPRSLDKFETACLIARWNQRKRAAVAVPVMKLGRRADLDAALQHYEQLSKMWGTLASWTSKMDTWLHEDFSSLHWEEESKEVQLFFKDSFGLAKKMPNDVSARTGCAR